MRKQPTEKITSIPVAHTSTEQEQPEYADVSSSRLNGMHSYSNERRGHIADSELHDLATGNAASGEVSISANLHAGQNYYIWVDNGGGGTISRITYQV